MEDNRWKNIVWGLKGGTEFGLVLAALGAIPTVLAEMLARGSGGFRNYLVALPIYVVGSALAGGFAGAWRQHLHRRIVVALIGAIVGGPLGIATGMLLGKLDESDALVIFLLIGVFLGITFSQVIWREENRLRG